MLLHFKHLAFYITFKSHFEESFGFDRFMYSAWGWASSPSDIR